MAGSGLTRNSHSYRLWQGRNGKTAGSNESQFPGNAKSPGRGQEEKLEEADLKKIQAQFQEKNKPLMAKIQAIRENINTSRTKLAPLKVLAMLLKAFIALRCIV